MDGVIVVATANDPTALDPAILRRPGRFDRVLACRPPTAELRLAYLRRLDAPGEGLEKIAADMDGFSYAQVRETFILAGQLAFGTHQGDISERHLMQALALVRGESWTVGSHRSAPQMGVNTSGQKRW
jgi:ATP-dependent 26S proteasome regulatory subunit